MIPINPTVVQTPDGAVGVLVARVGLIGCVELSPERILRAYPLTVLDYHLTPYHPPNR
jgi:hypothetical protein